MALTRLKVTEVTGSGQAALIIQKEGGSVGIGTGSPSARLDVSGDVNFDGAAVFNESGANKDFRIESDGMTHAFFVDAGTNMLGINTDSPKYLLDIKTNNGGIRLGNTTNSGEKSSNIHFTELASSDGLNAYGFSLNYNATDNAFNVMRHNNNTSGVSMMNFSRGFGNIQMGDVDASQFGGTSTPKLWVNADQNDRGIIRCSQHTDDNDPPQFEIAKARGTISSPAAIQASDYVGQLKVMGHDGTDFRISSDILWTAADAFTSTSRPSNLTIRTATSGTTTPIERMRVSHNGNVGIGTTTPDSKLHISSTAVGDLLFLETTEDSSSAGPVIALKRNSSSPADADYLGELKFQGENDSDQQVNYAKITAKILDASAGTEDGIIEFAIRKNGSNNIAARFRSDSLQLLNSTNLSVDGNVGIGTTSPDDPLDVTGNARISNHLALNCNGTSDPSLLVNHAHIYSKLVSGHAEMFVRDSNGNVTQISPHTPEGEWQYFSRNTRTGKVVRVNMEKMIRKLEEITGESFMEEWYEDPEGT